MNKITHIKQQTNCLSYLQNHGVQIIMGKNINCPLGTHEDKNPSFGLFENGDKFKCQSCGVHGDVIDLATLIHGETLDSLFSSFGGVLEDFSKKFQEKKVQKNSKIEKYLESRGVDLRFVSGVTGEDGDYLMVPIRDEEGKQIGIQKRNIHKKDFKIDGSSGFFWEDYKPEGTLYICEGVLDFLSLRQCTSHVLGLVSATSTTECEKIVNQYDKIVWLGDGDSAGIKQYYRFQERFFDREIFGFRGEKGKDINDLLLDFGDKDMFFTGLNSLIEPFYTTKKSKTIDSYTWGDDKLDEFISTFKKGDLSVLVADQNMGKSTFCFWLARENFKKYGHKSVYFSLESTQKEMFHSIALKHSGLDKISERDNLHFKNEIYKKKIEELKNEGGVKIIGKTMATQITIDEIEKIVYSLKSCDLLFIDNLLSIKIEGNDSNVGMGAVIQRLMLLSEKCGVPIILVHHYKKETKVFKEKGEWKPLDDMYGAVHIKTFAKLIIQIKRNPDADGVQDSSELCVREGKARVRGTRDETSIYHYKGDFYAEWADFSSGSF